MWSSREAASRLSAADRLAAALSSRCRSVRFVVLVGMVILVGDGVGGGELMPLLVDTLLVMALTCLAKVCGSVRRVNLNGSERPRVTSVE